jgi:cell division control protein 6
VLDQQEEKDEFSTREIHEVYQQVTSALGMDALSQRRMSDKLSEQTFLDILGRTDRKGRGYGRGVSHSYYLLEDPDVVQTVILQDSFFYDLAKTSVSE